MRQYLIVICFLLPLTAAAQGIQFDHDGWTSAVAKAKFQNKLVFLDGFTVWCGPCKLMSSKTFPDSSVGAYFNEHFINVKIDMERGEGIELAKRLNIQLYPTLLFADGDGNVVHRVAGYYGVEEFKALGRLALDPEKNLAALERKYKSGDRSEALLKDLMDAKAAAYDPDAGKIVQEFIKTQKDLGTPKNMEIIFTYVEDPFTDAFKYLVANRKKFNEVYSEPAVKEHIDQVFETYLQTHPTLQLGEVQRLYGTVYPEQGEKLASAYRLTYYRQRSDSERFAQSALDHYTRYPSTDADELNEIGWIFSQEVSDPKMLEQAIKWAKQSCKLRESYYCHETLAALYAKTGKKKQAIKEANTAIKLAKTSGDEAIEAQKVLNELNGKNK
jgi:thioredoxin-related protein